MTAVRAEHNCGSLSLRPSLTGSVDGLDYNPSSTYLAALSRARYHQAPRWFLFARTQSARELENANVDRRRARAQSTASLEPDHRARSSRVGRACGKGQ